MCRFHSLEADQNTGSHTPQISNIFRRFFSNTSFPPFIPVFHLKDHVDRLALGTPAFFCLFTNRLTRFIIKGSEYLQLLISNILSPFNDVTSECEGRPHGIRGVQVQTLKASRGNGASAAADIFTGVREVSCGQPGT